MSKTIQRFEDLLAWQEARKLVRKIYRATDDSMTRGDRALSTQLQRTAVSIMANIAEGFGRYTFKDCKQFYITARGSLAEMQSHLYVALDQSHIGPQAFNDIYNQSVLVNKLINGLITHLKSCLVNT